MSEKGPRPRRRLSSTQRREQLMDAAADIVAERGYRATTADAIVDHAGVSKGLLWRYFDDLDDLMAETARRTLATIATDVGAALDLNSSAPDIIRAAIARAARIPATHGRHRRALQEIVPNLRYPDGSPRLTLAAYDALHAGQEAIFRRGQAEGDIDPCLDPRILAITYQSAVDGMLDELERHPDRDPDQYATTLADILLSGATPR